MPKTPNHLTEASQSTLRELIFEACEQWSGETALVFGDQQITYGELAQSVCRVASEFRDIGISKGDRIVCSTSNRPEFVISMLATWACGAIHVGMDYPCSPSELNHIFVETTPKALVFEDDGSNSSHLEIIARGHRQIQFFAAGIAPSEGNWKSLRKIANERVEAEEHRDRFITLSPIANDDPALIFVTSGTTGRPKTTLGFQGNLGVRWSRLGQWLKFSNNDVHLAQLPLSHGFGLMMAMAALMKGGKLVLLRTFKATEALEAISRQRITVVNGSPAHFKLLLKYLARNSDHDVRSLRLSVGTAAVFSSQLVSDIWEQFGVEFMYMYGSSEGVGVATNDREDIIRGSVGRPKQGSVMIVEPETKHPLQVGETGEIAFSRQTFPVRYWKADKPTTESANSDPWYYSGDLGRLDEEGRLYVFGRLKHQIDRGGLKVDPVEVERAILNAPSISEAAVFGIPNEVLGELICACIVAGENEQPNLELLRHILSQHLAPYKIPDEFVVLENIPKTNIGKTDLLKLKCAVLERLAVRT